MLHDKSSPGRTQEVLLLELEGDSPKNTAPCFQHQWLSVSFALHQPFSNFPEEAAERHRHCVCLWPLKCYLSCQGGEQLPHLEEPNEGGLFVLEKGWLWASTAVIYRIQRGGGRGEHIFCTRARGLQTQHVVGPKPKHHTPV